MSTPDEPTRATGETGGPTDRVKPPPPRAFPWDPPASDRAARPVAPPQAGSSAAPVPPSQQPHTPQHLAPAAPEDAPTVVTTTKNGRPAAQSNVPRAGAVPVAGRPNPVREPAAAGVRKEAQRERAASIDGPTRHIARPELAKDMPDLSEVRHPTPVATEEAPAVRAVAAAAGAPLRATVQLRRIDPWSTLKVSLVISIALFFVWMVAVGLLYIVLDGMGVWDRLNNAFTDIVTESSSDGLVSASQVFGYAAGIGLINIVLFTGLATIGAFIYNQCSDLVGGIEVTLADPD